MVRMKTWTDEQLASIVARSNSYADVIRGLGLVISGKSLQYVRSSIVRLNISVEHFLRREVKRSRKQKRLTDDDVFREDSTVGSTRLRAFVKKSGRIPCTCSECGNVGVHNGKKLTLQLDHRNGINTDNRVGNLRFLCPNCHSQTDTYSRAKRSRTRQANPSTAMDAKDMYGKYVSLTCDCCGRPFYRKPSRVRSDFSFCGHECARIAQAFLHGHDGIGPQHGTLAGYFKCKKPRCEACKAAMRDWQRSRADKALDAIAWPSAEEFKTMVWQEPATALAKRLGVSSTAVKKRCSKLGIDTPGPGYWNKLPSST